MTVIKIENNLIRNSLSQKNKLIGLFQLTFQGISIVAVCVMNVFDPVFDE